MVRAGRHRRPPEVRDVFGFGRKIPSDGVGRGTWQIRSRWARQNLAVSGNLGEEMPKGTLASVKRQAGLKGIKT